MHKITTGDAAGYICGARRWQKNPDTGHVVCLPHQKYLDQPNTDREDYFSDDEFDFNVDDDIAIDDRDFSESLKEAVHEYKEAAEHERTRDRSRREFAPSFGPVYGLTPTPRYTERRGRGSLRV